MSQSKPGAFTLIELLVVITIIAVLLAMLTPALDKAIYQAELAVCATKLHAIYVGAQSYAMNHHRRYPDRNVEYMVDANGQRVGFAGSGMEQIFNAPPLAPPEKDLRKMLKGYIQVNAMLNDPLVKPVDFEKTQESFCLTNYDMYYGFRFVNTGGGKGMYRLGDRWTFTSFDDGKTRLFEVFAMDKDHPNPNNKGGDTAHPDDEGRLVNIALQDEIAAGDGVSPPVATGAFSNTAVISTWCGTYDRSPVDLNVVTDDGGVERFTKVPVDAWAVDEAFTRVPKAAAQPNNKVVEEYHNVPIR